MMRTAKNGITTGGQFCGGMLSSPTSFAVRLSESIRLPNGGGKRDREEVSPLRDIGPGQQYLGSRLLVMPPGLDRGHL